MSTPPNNAVSCEKLIGANFHVTITDSRILEGILTVIDPFGNLLLSNVYETSKDKFDKTKLHVREIGLVSVPRETIVNIKVDSKTHKNIFGKI
ncbi:hypothetical protein CANMA_000633 [Candida margitis]|uniref:uncharacterized protein n=1 Tax=Candida margitis TaxID=1775924 RepID=UPI00222622CC|nr:uncharacterized protein CANMA_000633 [Candida margitis]KAI5970281.1 hypothetical protein CANMA_000633 [Candida margitis]